jgi:hypothetical protein
MCLFNLDSAVGRAVMAQHIVLDFGSTAALKKVRILIVVNLFLTQQVGQKTSNTSKLFFYDS